MGAREEKNMETVRKAIEAFNQRDLEAYWDCHTQDTTYHEVYFTEPQTKDQMSRFMLDLWDSYPDWIIKNKNMIASGDKVAIENEMSATFENDQGELKATGKKFVVWEGVFFDMKDGKIQHMRMYMNRKSQEQQLGLS